MDDEIEVPCHFLCPISMELMRDPVTVVSGITYDRDSIERWLSSSVKDKKNNTCPVTKQNLTDASLTPNHTLRRLIHSWCSLHGVDVVAQRAPDPNTTPAAVVDQPRILELLRVATESQPPELAVHLRRLSAAFHLGSDPNVCKCLDESGAVEFLASVIKKSRCSAACPAEVGFPDSSADEALSLLYHMHPSEARLRRLAGDNGEMVECLLHALAHGKRQTRAYAVLVMRSVSGVGDTVRVVGAGREVLPEVVRVLRDRISHQATKAAVKVLVEVCRWGRNRVKAVEAGAVHALVEVLLAACGSAERRCCELALVGLEQLCSCAEGRAELLRHWAGVAVVSKRMLRVSAAATDRAVRVLSWICRLSATGRVLHEMLQVGAVAKLCLVLQVETGLNTKERIREILRLHAKAWKASPCIPSHLLCSYPPF